MDLLTERGFPELTIDAVAARAGVGRPTIYRRWPGKLQLVLEAVLRSAPRLEYTPSGNSLIDLTRLISTLIAEMTSSPTGHLILILTSDPNAPSDMRTMLAERYLTPRRQVLLNILKQGVTDGELSPDADLDLMLDLALGASTYRWITTGRPVSRRAAAEVVRAVWASNVSSRTE
jgi:AcrR family transcriptional regulator